LEAERTTFRAVHDSVLRELVEALLSNPTLKLDAVAHSVGFGDLAAFSKAFRRWTGCTPARYRAQLAGSGGKGHQDHAPPSWSPATQPPHDVRAASSDRVVRAVAPTGSAADRSASTH